MSEHRKSFTPGPWRVRQIAELDEYKNASICIFACDDGVIGLGKNAEEIVTMPNHHRYPEKEEIIRANARLISAAPKMYELLEQLYGALTNVPVVQVEIEKVLKQARGEV